MREKLIEWVSVIFFRNYWTNIGCGFPDIWDGERWYGVENVKTGCCLYVNTAGQFARLGYQNRRFPAMFRISRFIVHPYSVSMKKGG